jgi:PAS domain S-box-containing protein
MNESWNRQDNVRLAPLYRMLFERSPTAALVLDATGEVLASNAAAQWLARGNSIPPLAELTASEPSALLRNALAQHAEWIGPLTFAAGGGGTRRVEVKLLPAPLSDGEPPRFLCLVEDAAPGTASRSIEVEEEQMKRRHRESAENAPVMIWMASPDGMCDWFNTPWLAFTGRHLDQLAGSRWLQDVHPEDRERCVGIYATSFEARQAFSLDLRLRRHDGEYRWVMNNGMPRYAADGRYEGYIGCCVDIHERKELEERLAGHTQTLRLADRRQSEFIAMLSHELRNPLAPIANAASVLQTLEGDNPTLKRLRQILERQVARLRRIVDDLVDVTRVMQGQIALTRESLDVGDVVRAAIEIVQPKLDASGHGLKIELPDPPVRVRGDSVRLAQALSNIILNAGKFTPIPSPIELSAKVEQGAVNIRVKDQGQGIAPEFLPHVFELFAQQDQTMARTYGGLGIGLTLSKRIAQLHGGDIRALSEGPGKGSEFVVSLPVSAGTPAAAETSAAVARTPARDNAESYRVLIIEDNADTRYLLRLQMELWGNEVMTAADAEAGLRITEQFKPQIVLCDLGLPGLDGFQLIKPLREKLAGQRTMFAALTGYGRYEDESRALTAGFDAFLVKPLRPDSLSSLFKSYADRAAQH